MQREPVLLVRIELIVMIHYRQKFSELDERSPFIERPQMYPRVVVALRDNMKTVRFVSVHEMLSSIRQRLADSSSATPLLKLLCPNLVRLDHDMQICLHWRSPDCVAQCRVFRLNCNPGSIFIAGGR